MEATLSSSESPLLVSTSAVTTTLDIDGTFWKKHLLPALARDVQRRLHGRWLLDWTAIPNRASFLAIGDWGEMCDNLLTLARRMSIHAASSKPDFIMALGDNFYPSGALKAGDQEFTMWRTTFIDKYPNSLGSIPWKVVLGNHDYMGNPKAQIEYTTHPSNPNGLWQMPSNKYSFSMPCGPNGETIAFIAFDANACQFSVRNAYPEKLDEFPADAAWLAAELAKYKDATWRVYFAHHPFYTAGRGHLNEARCLRSRKYRSVKDDVPMDGLDLEKVLVEGGVDLVMAGHEHMMQLHTTTTTPDSVGGGKKAATAGNNLGSAQPPPPASSTPTMTHMCCGATLESYWYKGQVLQEQMDWIGSGQCGFGAVEAATEHGVSKLRLRFINVEDGTIIKELVKTKPVPAHPHA